MHSCKSEPETQERSLAPLPSFRSQNSGHIRFAECKQAG
jgi:hypothetical protein